MNREEAELGEVKSYKDIPMGNRIADIEVKFDLVERKGVLHMSRGRSADVLGRETSYEVIEW